MKTFIKGLAKILVVSLLVASSSNITKEKVYATQSKGPKNSNKEIIVKFKDSESAEKVKKQVKSKYKISMMETKKKLHKGKGEVIELGDNDDINTIINELKSNPNVLYAQPNYKLTTFELPIDKNFIQQWALQNTGQAILGQVGKNGVDINAVKAWTITKGSQDVIVGVLDTGIDINHVDLKDNIYVNDKEIPNNGIDDDNNGFIDDLTGWDFVNDDNSLFDSAILDDHGTHVSGIIAASSNDEGIIGVAPKVRILPLKFINGSVGYTSDAIDAIEYAEKMGVSIVNCSWGGSEYNQALKDAMEESNMLFICAAGNNSNTTVVYPSAFQLPNIISVGAISNDGNLSAFSNYGSQVDIAAPGVNILSTLPNNTYGMKSGTSTAAPYVTGTAALIKSRYLELSNIDIGKRINGNVTRLDSLSGKVITSGIVNAYSALSNSTIENESVDSVGKIEAIIINPDNKDLSEVTKVPTIDVLEINNEKEQSVSSQLKNKFESIKIEDIKANEGISNVQIELVKDNILSVSWTTSEMANSQFYYGKNKSLQNNKCLNIEKYTHQIFIKDFNLKENNWYQIKSESKDGRVFETEISKLKDVVKVKEQENKKELENIKASAEYKKANSKNTTGSGISIENTTGGAISVKQSNVNIQDITTLITEVFRETESNDTIRTANYLPPETKMIKGEMNYRYEINGRYGSYRDEDWFMIELHASEGINISLSDSNYYADYDLELYNENGEYVDGSYNGYGEYDQIQCFSGGLHYIRVYGTYSDGEDEYGFGYYPYTLTLESIIAPDQYEENDYKYFATNVLLDTDYYATISSYVDEDWYYLDADKAGVLMVSLQNVPEECDYRISVYNSQRSIDNSGDDFIGSSSSGQEVYSVPISSSGKYYFKVYTINWSSAENYKIRVSISEDLYEPNNSYITASNINTDKEIRATIHEEHDEDWYKITINDSCKVNYKLENIPVGCDYDIVIYNSSFTVIGGSYRGLNSSEDITLPHVKGVYYIKVYPYRGYSSKEQYKLTATYIDTQSPTAPTNLSVLSRTGNSVMLNWTASTDNVGVTAYDIYINGNKTVSNVVGTSYLVEGLMPNKAYSIIVKARDSAQNISEASNEIVITLTYGKIEYRYDANNRIEKVLGDGQIILEYIYDDNGNLKMIKRP